VGGGYRIPRAQSPWCFLPSSSIAEFSSLTVTPAGDGSNDVPIKRLRMLETTPVRELSEQSRSSLRYRGRSVADVRKCFAAVILERPRVVVPEFADAHPEYLDYLKSVASSAQAKALRPLNEVFVKRKPAAGDMFAEAAASKNTQLMMAARWKAAPRKTVADERSGKRKGKFRLGWRRSLSRELQVPTYLVVQDSDGTARFPRARLRHSINESMRECAGRALAGIRPVGGSSSVMGDGSSTDSDKIKGSSEPVEVHWVGHAPKGHLRARAPGKVTFFYWAKYISGGRFWVPRGIMPEKPVTGPDYAWLTRKELLDPNNIPSSKMRTLIAQILPL